MHGYSFEGMIRRAKRSVNTNGQQAIAKRGK
jgi:hypothetical protein